MPMRLIANADLQKFKAPPHASSVSSVRGLSVSRAFDALANPFVMEWPSQRIALRRRGFGSPRTAVLLTHEVRVMIGNTATFVTILGVFSIFASRRISNGRKPACRE
jgi:hypothetical protein